jgi:hypothetical protein
MSFVVTVGSDVECPDHGRAQMTSQAKLTVATKPVVREADLLVASIGGCLQVPPPASNVQCLKVASLFGGKAARLTAGGQPVLLDDTLAAASSGAPKNQVTCKDAGQKKLLAK